MATEWRDIPGVTAVGGRPRLPCEPDVVVRALLAAVEGDSSGGVGMAELIDRVQRATRVERARLEGLAGWLPLSHVARWEPRSGRLVLHPGTDVQDLAIRYAAWISTQPVPREHVDSSLAYAKRVGELATELVQAGRAPAAVFGTNAIPPPASAPGRPAPVPTDLTRRIASILNAMDRGFLERRAHTRAALLALLTGQHVLLLGPPGTAKSMLARALCGAFEDAAYFEYLLSRFTHPDELFGPVSIPGLKDEDYRRLTEGFLPRAGVAFLDEIFKANSAILNSLLTLVNERVFHHGRHRDPVPLIGLVGASNELPDPEGGLGALFDRFLVRLTVPSLAGADAFLRVATGEVDVPVIPAESRLRRDDLVALRAAAAAIVVPPAVRDALVGLWRTATRLEWQVSDRRWRAAVQMLRIGAAASGRGALDPLDLLLLEPVVAPTPDRAPEVREAILEHIGTLSLPEHDLRAQWMLLKYDRVAPVDGSPVRPPPAPDLHWSERIEVRRTHLGRFLAHHAAAVARLGQDRADVEALAEAHLWLDQLPAQILASHIEASRDLARTLARAEDYRRSLASPAQIAAALLNQLPETSRRVYGTGAVCLLEVADADVRTGITLAGEREAIPVGAIRDDGMVVPDPSNVPVVQLTADRFLDFVDGRLELRDLLNRVPAYASRNATTAFQSVRRLLAGSAVPTPPDLP